MILVPRRRLIMPRRQRGWIMTPYGFGVRDPLFASVLYLLDGEGNSLADKSSHAWTTTPGGSPSASSSSPIVGFYSPLFNGTTDYLSVASSSDWNFGAADHTIEVKFRLASLATQQVVIATRSTFAGQQSGFELNINTNGSGFWAWYTGVSGFTQVDYAAGTFTTGVDYDAAVVRGTVSAVLGWRAFLGGSLIDTETTLNTFQAPSQPLSVGALNQTGGTRTRFLNGRVEARITTAARYTTGYTPPASWPTS